MKCSYIVNFKYNSQNLQKCPIKVIKDLYPYMELKDQESYERKHSTIPVTKGSWICDLCKKIYTLPSNIVDISHVF